MSAPARVPLTVVILTFNEEANLAQALDSVCGWAEDVVVLDSFSTDGTLDVARRFPCRVLQRRFDSFSGQRNYALKEIPDARPWVLFLDADERIPAPLAEEIGRVLAAGPKEDGFELNRRFLWTGRWIRRGYYPLLLVRLVRRAAARCEDRLVNEHLVVDGAVGRLSEDFVHESLSGLASWTLKHDDYARKEALEALAAERRPAAPYGRGQAERKRWVRERIWNRLPLFVRPFLYFGYRYVLRGGFLDGAAALNYHALQALWFPMLVDSYILEFRRKDERTSRV